MVKDINENSELRFVSTPTEKAIFDFCKPGGKAIAIVKEDQHGITIENIPEMLSTLKDLQWGNSNDGHGKCPYCNADELLHQHRVNCRFLRLFNTLNKK